jgi:hypothetical protein
MRPALHWAAGMSADRTKWWLALILGVGILLRLGSAIFQGNQVVPMPGAYDQIFYHDLALNVLEGKGFVFTRPPWPFIQPGAPTAYYSFVYPLFLAAIYTVTGPEPIAARIVQALICSLLPYQVYVLTKQVLSMGKASSHSPRRDEDSGEGPSPALGKGLEATPNPPRAGHAVALVAAGITAVYAYFLLYSASLQTEGVYLVLVAWALILTLRLADAPTWQRWLAWGLAATLATEVRQVFMPVALLLFVFIVARARRRVKVCHVALAGAVAVALILPFTIRNYRVYGQFLLLNSQYGQVLWNANHPDLGTRFVPDAMFAIPGDLEGADEVELTNDLMRRGMQLIAAEPWRFVQLSASRAATLFMFWPSRQSPLVSNIARTLSFAICLPFMIAGLVISMREWKRWLLFYLFVAVYALIHVVSWAQIRYRMPVDMVLVPFAALALVSAARWLASRRRPSAVGHAP